MSKQKHYGKGLCYHHWKRARRGLDTEEALRAYFSRRDVLNEQRRKRYKADPEYRQRRIDAAARNYQRKRLEMFVARLGKVDCMKRYELWRGMDLIHVTRDVEELRWVIQVSGYEVSGMQVVEFAHMHDNIWRELWRRPAFNYGGMRAHV